MIQHPKVSRPRVPVHREPAAYGPWVARCAHCAWTYTANVGAAAREQADHHRHQHATGQIEVTR